MSEFDLHQKGEDAKIKRFSLTDDNSPVTFETKLFGKMFEAKATTTSQYVTVIQVSFYEYQLKNNQ